MSECSRAMGRQTVRRTGRAERSLPLDRARALTAMALCFMKTYHISRQVLPGVDGEGLVVVDNQAARVADGHMAGACVPPASSTFLPPTTTTPPLIYS